LEGESEQSPIKLRIYGLPAPQGSKKVRGYIQGRAILGEASKRVAPWRENIIWQSRKQYKGVPLEGPLQISITFWLPRPKGHYRTIDGKLSNIIKPGKPTHTIASTQGDVDKLIRSTFDGLAAKTGGCVAQDDSQFVRLKNIEKCYVTEDEVPGAFIEVSKYTGKAVAD
jgi:Holliday junction resolvase RusA-like endonuclease